MKIKSMTATFGKLDKARLELGPGLNLIHAPNEGGKSTWAGFWRAMLYGIRTGEKDKKGYLADKNRFQPWSGAPMEGEVELEYGGRDITIRRGPRGSTPFGTFSAVYTGTQEPVPGLTASNCGELLTGAGAEVFTRSAFLGDGNLSLTTAPELERRIAALVTSGQEDVSFSQAMGRLKDWKNRRQVNRSVGEIPKLEAELDQVREALEQLEEVAARAARLEGERAELERRRDQLARQDQAHRALAQKQLSDRYARAEEEYRTAQNQYDALEKELGRFGVLPDREELKKAQGELQYIKVLDDELKQGSAAREEAEEAAEQANAAARDEHFPEMTGDEAAALAEKESAEYQAAAEAVKKTRRRLPLFLLAGVLMTAAILIIDYLYNRVSSGISYFKIDLLPCLLMAFLGIWRVRRAKKRQERMEDRLLSQYGVASAEALSALAQNYKERCQAAERAAHEAEVIQTAVADRQSKRDGARSDLLDFVHSFAPEVKDLFGCSAALSRALGLDHDLSLARERATAARRRLDDLAAQGGQAGPGEALDLPIPGLDREETLRALSLANSRLEEVSARLNQARGSLRAMGDPAALAARREELEGRLARKRLEADALAAAMDALTRANARLQERFSPELNALTGEYMSRLTGGKYPAVSLTRELEGFVRSGGDVLPRSALFLSRGTADQLYLAIRLAVCRLCLPERPPILLDDALAAFDDRRLSLALELLWELSGEQQLLLFTCQKREGEALGSTPGVKKVEL